jgi:hypothetical protein
VRAEEGDDEDLIFKGEAGELGKAELAFDGDLLLGNADALNDDGRTLGDAEQVLPVGNGLGGGFSTA